MKILISGARGRMGRGIERKKGENEIVCGICRTFFDAKFPLYESFENIEEDFDIIIDFSVAENVEKVLEFTERCKKPLIMGTTGLSERDENRMKELSKVVPILYSHNTSLGVNRFLQILENAAAILKDEYDIEIIEKHDRGKKDAPSGTAGMVLQAIEDGSKINRSVVNGRKGVCPRADGEIGVHSIRGGNLGSEHYVSFITEDETIEINHYSPNYDIYCSGAVKAGEVLVKLAPGLYSMRDIIERM
ncbi:MAG: 4-hydroxy-tetrahydrodipicolinate reductase [Tissierellia bacterium]|nr:4-hydroxy-tetrahydrodipicolinate reductase [Tissierellia bacterium]